MIPSPQTTLHTDGDPKHSNPVITSKQSLVHPLLSFQIPSSQISAPTIKLSPHISVQTEGDPTQSHPASSVHVLSHPSPFHLLPSSQFSDEILVPSPQLRFTHVSALLGFPP